MGEFLATIKQCMFRRYYYRLYNDVTEIPGGLEQMVYIADVSFPIVKYGVNIFICNISKFIINFK